MIEYVIAGSAQSVVLADAVLNHFARYRQLKFWHREAGGQLFARDTSDQLIIERATGPRKTDWRSRFLFIPDRKAERAEIQNLHSEGLHFVGDWHTHPQRRPHFSTCDVQSISECFRKSKHQLNCFVLIIVGQDDPPAGQGDCVKNTSKWIGLAKIVKHDSS